jgi:hypothetical protein
MRYLMLGVMSLFGVVLWAAVACVCSLDPCSDLAEAYRRRLELEAINARALDRLRAKEDVARAVERGRLSLWQAVARYRELNRQAGWPGYADAFPPGAEDELLARQVIEYVEGLVSADSSEDGQDLVVRLHEELNDHSRRHGPHSRE